MSKNLLVSKNLPKSSSNLPIQQENELVEKDQKDKKIQKS